MANIDIEFELSSKGIDKAIKQLEQYKKDLLTKIETLIDRLADVGIAMAEMQTGKWHGFIVFEKQKESAVDGYALSLIGRDADPNGVYISWKTGKDTEDGYNVSPLLLAEFGSGFLSNPRNVAGVGQGTMPNAKGHANDPNGWMWVDSEGFHKSIGEEPTMPMYFASLEIQGKFDQIVREVFK